MQQNNETCPVSFSPINQTKVRLVAFFVLILSIIYCAYPHWSVAGLLLIDFSCRAFQMQKFSPFNALADQIILALSLPVKRANAAAKEFAALLGFILCDVLFIISALSLYDVGVYIAAVLVCFSFLESAFGICVGCYVYPYFQKTIASGAKEDITTA